MLGNAKKDSTKPTLMSTEETREYLNKIYAHPNYQSRANVMPERRVMSVDETREYLNHIYNQPSASVSQIQIRSLSIGKSKL